MPRKSGSKSESKLVADARAEADKSIKAISEATKAEETAEMPKVKDKADADHLSFELPKQAHHIYKENYLKMSAEEQAQLDDIAIVWRGRRSMTFKGSLLGLMKLVGKVYSEAEAEGFTGAVDGSVKLSTKHVVTVKKSSK